MDHGSIKGGNLMRGTADFREARAELITALLLIVVFVLFLFGRVSDPLAMMLGGVILLGSGIYQTSRGWHVALTTWIVGLVLFFGGLGVRMFLVTFLSINWVLIALLLVGAYILWQTFRRRA
jgi:hypothetical protein